MRAIVVDKDYGSVTPQELDRVAAAYQAAGIQMELLEYQVEATRQKEPTEEEIIAGCQGAQVLLATGNPPITRKVMETLPEVKFVQRFGAGVNSIDLAAAAELGVIVLNLPGFELSMLVMASGSRSCSEAIRLFAIDECKGKHFLLVYPNFCSSIFLGFSEISLNQPNLVEISCN